MYLMGSGVVRSRSCDYVLSLQMFPEVAVKVDVAHHPACLPAVGLAWLREVHYFITRFEYLFVLELLAQSNFTLFARERHMVPRRATRPTASVFVLLQCFLIFGDLPSTFRRFQSLCAE